MKKNVNAKVEELLVDKLRVVAKNEGFSYPQAVAIALHQYIKAYEKKNGEISNQDILQMQLFL